MVESPHESLAWRHMDKRMNGPKNYLIDTDGVLVSGSTMIVGADQFLQRVRARQAEYLLLTNNSMYTPRAPAAHSRSGASRRGDLHVGLEHSPLPPVTEAPGASLRHRRERPHPGHPRHRLCHHRT